MGLESSYIYRHSNTFSINIEIPCILNSWLTFYSENKSNQQFATSHTQIKGEFFTVHIWVLLWNWPKVENLQFEEREHEGWKWLLDVLWWMSWVTAKSWHMSRHKRGRHMHRELEQRKIFREWKKYSYNFACVRTESQISLSSALDSIPVAFRLCWAHHPQEQIWCELALNAKCHYDLRLI